MKKNYKNLLLADLLLKIGLKCFFRKKGNDRRNKPRVSERKKTNKVSRNTGIYNPLPFYYEFITNTSLKSQYNM